jgi:hypothetical protein
LLLSQNNKEEVAAEVVEIQLVDLHQEEVVVGAVEDKNGNENKRNGIGIEKAQKRK